MDPVTFLEELLAIPSPSTQEAAVAARLVRGMSELGFDARVDEAGNAVGVAGDGPRQIVLLGHMDTVPGGPSVERRDGRLYGRGAVDAKGPLAAFALAAGRLVGSIPDGWQLVVVGAVEEEAATSKGARHAATVYAPAYCIIGEPSGWDAMTLGYKGRLLCHFDLAQPMAHTAGPGQAVAEFAVAFWNEVVAYVERLNEGRAGAFERLMPSLRQINTTVEEECDHVRAVLGFRLPPDLAPEELEATLLALPHHPDATLAFRGHEATYVADRNTPLARAFMRSIRAAGGRPRFKLKTGTSDMNVVGPVWRCPILAYGPGDSALDHTPDEHVEIDEYLRAIDVLERVLRELLSEGT
jgi:LysW-gamma-L-lysine carboxypeptidase